MNVVDAFNQAGIFAKLSLLTGFGPLVVAISYLLRPSERKLMIMRPVSLAAIFAAISGLVVGFIAALVGMGTTLPQWADMAPFFLGVAEALVAPFFNFGLLAVAWLLVAIGMARSLPRGTGEG